MFFLFCLSLAIYFGLLSAGNIRIAVRMPGTIFRWLAIVLHGILLLTLFCYLGIRFYIFEYGYQSIAHWWDYRGPIMQGYFLPYWLLALTILGSYGWIAVKGLQKVDGKFRAYHWSLSTIYTAALLSLAIAGLLYRELDYFAKVGLAKEQTNIEQQVERIYNEQPPAAENAWSVYKTIEREPNSIFSAPLWDEKLLHGLSRSSITGNDLQSARPTILKLRAASRLAVCKAPREGFKSHFCFEIQDLACWLNLLHYDAYVQAAQGNPQESVQDIIAMWRLSEHCAQDPRKEYYAYSFRLDQCTETAMEYLLSKHQLPAGDLEQLLKYRPGERQANLIRNIELEGLMTRYSLIGEYLKEDFKLENFNNTNGWLAWGRLFFAQFDLQSQQQLEDLHIADVKLPKVKLPLFDQSPHYRRLRESGLLSRDSYFDTNPCRWKESTLHAEACMRLTRIGIAAYLFALQKKRFPHSMEELRATNSTANLTDPYSGESFKMFHQADKLILYSVGENRSDDSSIAVSGEFWKGDILFTIHLPPN